MTEGFLQNHIKSTLQSLRVAYGNPPPFTREAEYEVAPTDCADIPLRAKHPLLSTLLFSLFTLLCPSGQTIAYAIPYSIKILGGFA